MGGDVDGGKLAAALRGRGIDAAALAAALGILGTFVLTPMQKDLAELAADVQKINVDIARLAVTPQLNAERLARAEERTKELRVELQALEVRMRTLESRKPPP